MSSASALWRRHWRIAVVGVLGALLAFAGSFLVDPTFTASTRLLIHGRSATFMTSTGDDLSNQPGIVDASLSQSLASTYAGIATSRATAVSVVDQLSLDRRPPRAGLIDWVAGGLAWVYRCTKAVVTAGYCADIDPYQQAVTEVMEGTSAEPLGTNAGSSAGTTGSYVLEVTSSGRTPQEAHDVTNAVADTLVAASGSKFRTDSSESIARLRELVADAEKQAADQGARLAEFRTGHGMTAADGQQTLSATTRENIRTDLVQARAEQADLRAQLSSIEATLSSTPKGDTTSQKIVTGRSTTTLESAGSSSVYNDLLLEKGRVQAQLQGQSARVAELEFSLANAAPLTDNSIAAEHDGLVEAVDRAQSNLASVNKTLEAALVTAARGPVDLTRLDEAGVPVYPSAPKRYLYLALGLLIGGVAGGVLGAYQRRRAAAPAPADDAVGPPDASGGEAAVPDGTAIDHPNGSRHPLQPAGADARDGHRPTLADELFGDDG